MSLNQGTSRPSHWTPVVILTTAMAIAVCSVIAAYFGMRSTTPPVSSISAPDGHGVNEVITGSTDVRTDTSSGGILIDKAVELVGSDKFRCKAGFVPVRVVIGQGDKNYSLHYSILNGRPGMSEKLVVFKIHVPDNLYVPVMIVNTQIHNQRRDAYSQKLFALGLGPNESGAFWLNTRYSIGAFRQPNITDVTVCTVVTE